jgi:hypothetical protein
MVSKTSSRAAGLALAMVLCAGNALQANPFVMSYSGRLANASGEGVAGPVKLEFKFYNVASGGSAIAVSPIVKNSVPLEDGVFQVDLTELLQSEYHLVLSTTGTQSVWIEVRDVTNGKTYPRQRLTAVPYAMKVPVDGVKVLYNSDGKLTTANSIPSGGSANQFLMTDGAGNLSWGTPSGAGDMNKSTYDTNADGVVDTALNATNATDSTKLGGNAASYYRDASNINAGTVGVAHLPVGTTSSHVAAGNDSRFLGSGNVTSSHIQDGTIATADVANLAITDAKIDSITTAGKVSGGAINSGTIGGATAISTTGSISSGNITSTGTISGAAISASGNISSGGILSSSSAVQAGSYMGIQNHGVLKLFEQSGNGSNYVAFKGPANVPADYIIELPSSPPTEGQVMAFNGSSFDWQTPVVAAPGGSDGHLQFNNAGSFGGVSDMKYLFGSGFLGVGTTTPSAKLQVQGSLSSNKVAVFKGAASQSVNMLEVQDNAGTLHVAVKPDGMLEAGRLRSGAHYVKVVNCVGTPHNVASDEYMVVLGATACEVNLPLCSVAMDGRVVKIVVDTVNSHSVNGTFLGSVGTLAPAGTVRTFTCLPSNKWSVE